MRNRISHSGVPANSVAALIEHAKRNPGRLGYGSSGTGSPHHLSGELLRQLVGIDIVHAHEVKSDVITYLASKLRRVPIVTTLHGWIDNRAKDRLMTAVDRQVLRGFDCVIAVSGQPRGSCSIFTRSVQGPAGPVALPWSFAPTKVVVLPAPWKRTEWTAVA